MILSLYILLGKPPPHITQEMNVVGRVFLHYKTTNSSEWDAYVDLVNVFKAFMPGKKLTKYYSSITCMLRIIFTAYL